MRYTNPRTLLFFTLTGSQWSSAKHYYITGPVGERLQAGTEDVPVLDRPAPLRRLHDSGAGYKYSDLLKPTY